MTDEKDKDSSACSKNPGELEQDIPIIHVHDLMQNSKEAILIHRRERYRLRITAKDKLILTK
jgi:hemin uptake protein HemP